MRAYFRVRVLTWSCYVKSCPRSLMFSHQSPHIVMSCHIVCWYCHVLTSKSSHCHVMSNQVFTLSCSHIRVFTLSCHVASCSGIVMFSHESPNIVTYQSPDETIPGLCMDSIDEEDEDGKRLSPSSLSSSLFLWSLFLSSFLFFCFCGRFCGCGCFCCCSNLC